jgi:Pathogenicity locus
MSETLITIIPGIGKTFAQDFARIGYHFIEDFEGKNVEVIFSLLVTVNEKENHKTSKSYLYVIRMICYYANGGRETEKLKWSYWK